MGMSPVRLSSGAVSVVPFELQIQYGFSMPASGSIPWYQQPTAGSLVGAAVVVEEISTVVYMVGIFAVHVPGFVAVGVQVQTGRSERIAKAALASGMARIPQASPMKR